MFTLIQRYEDCVQKIEQYNNMDFPYLWELGIIQGWINKEQEKIIKLERAMKISMKGRTQPLT